jgi:hypothetical protein
MSTFRSEQLRQPLSLSGSFTGSLAGTASFATTSSFALFAANGGGGGTTFPYTGSAIISGSLIVTGSTISTLGFTGSLQGTASFAQNSVFKASAGTGISISPTSGTGSITITNDAPDQTISLTDGTGISVTGTYPSFTITNSAPRIGPNYSQILFIFSQSGSNDPTFNGGDLLINTSEATFTFTIRGTGYYELASSTPIFTSGRTAVYLTPGYKIDTFTNNNRFSIWFEIVDTSTINIYSLLELKNNINFNHELFIKEAIAHGLIRLLKNKYVLKTGEFIADSLEEAIAWVKDPQNSTLVKSFEVQINKK